jgi:hypothetical protein
LKRDEVVGGWRKLHDEELHNLYSVPSVIKITKSRRTRWAGHVACMQAKKNADRILVGKPERNRPLGRLRHRFAKMDLREIGWDDMNSIDLAHSTDQWRALVNMVMNLQVS